MLDVSYDFRVKRSFLRIVSKSLLIFLAYLSNCQVGTQDIIVAFPGQDVDVELMCDVTGDEGTAWRINGTLHLLSELFAGVVAGHNVSGRNLVVEDIIMNDVRNGSQYQCEITQIPPDPNIVGNLTILYVAGSPLMVPNVMIDFTFTLSWGEPFNNLDFIVNYTVVWNSGTLLQNFTTTDNTTKIYTITNLIPLTAYTFLVVATNSIGSGPAGVEMITTPSGHPYGVPNVMISEDSVRINGNNVTLTLSWGEPFSYFGSIISYTVSWNDGTSLKNFTTTDNSTRSYTITNLTPRTDYTFSVVATNSFGSGEAGVLLNTIPGISQVNGIELQCSLVTLINQCTVTWRWNNLQETVTNFSIASNVGRFSAPSQSTSHIFPVLSLPDGAQNSEVTVKVVAVNELGQGPPSEVVRTNITVPSVINAAPMLVCTLVVSELYNITVTCTIHPDSIVDHCVVMAMADDEDTIAGNATITEGMATVVINNLECGVTYNITAEGILNETLVGSRLSHGIINAGPCPMTSNGRPSILEVDKESDDEFSTGAAVTISIVVTLVVTALISVLFTSLYYKHLIIKTNQKIGSHSLTEDIKRHDPATVSASITMDTNPAYGNTATIKMNTNPSYGDINTIKMGTNPAYATTSH